MSTVLDPAVTPGASPTPAGTPPADPGVSPTPGSVAPSPSASPESPNLRQLREQYETTKHGLERWSQLGKYEDIQSRMQVFSTLSQEVNELGESLGYAAEEVQAAFAKDPVATLQVLRQKAEQSRPQPITAQDLRKQLRQEVQNALKPVTEREQQRLAEEAEARFDGEFDRLYKAQFKDGLPDECKEALHEMVSNALSENPEALQRLMGRQVADVARLYQEQAARFLKIANAYIQHERKRTSQDGPPAAPDKPEKPPSAMDAKILGGKMTVRELTKGLW